MDIHSKNLKYLIDRLSEKYNRDPKEIKHIISVGQFKCVKEVMKQASGYDDHWPYIKLPYLMQFKVKDGKKKFFRNKCLKEMKDVQDKQGK